MTILYILLFLMLFTAISLLAIPFLKTHSIFSKKFFFLTISLTVTAIILYLFTSNQPALYQWFTTGKKHYQLQVDVDKLGGIDGMITRIKKKLADNPNDMQGWLILGKLYLFQNKQDDASAAFEKARQIQRTKPRT